jgi:hypothetical protein
MQVLSPGPLGHVEGPDPLGGVISVTPDGSREGSGHPAIGGELRTEVSSTASLLQEESPHELRELREILLVLAKEFFHVL